MVEKKCDRCAGDLDEGSIYTRHDKEVCKYCANNYVECNDCGYFVHESDIKEIFGGDRICAECLEDDYFTCPKCGEMKRANLAKSVEDSNDVCDTCFSEHYRQCHYCDNHFLYGDSMRGGHIFYEDAISDYACDGCIDEYMDTCFECEQLLPRDDGTIIGGEFYCEECKHLASKCFFCGGSLGASGHESEWICRHCFDNDFSDAYDKVSVAQVLSIYPDLKKRIRKMFELSVINRGEIVGLSAAMKTLEVSFSHLVEIDFSKLKYVEKNGTRKGELSDLGSPRNYFYKQLSERAKEENISALISTVYNKMRDAKMVSEEYTDRAYPPAIAALRYRLHAEHADVRTAIDDIRGIYKLAHGIYVEVSDDPVDMLMKSTGQTWEVKSCEKFTGDYKEGPFCDIAHSNLVVFVKNEDGVPVARIMLRWCYDVDDVETGFGIEEKWYFGKGKGSSVENWSKSVIHSGSMNLSANRATGFIEGILESNGLYSYEQCVTPYDYTGFSDTAKTGNTSIEYKKRRHELN